mmetsp:Transcript_45390/g.144706  ORF Transcript_45390/g.144706 Transcript_45390/m.144706 type:complete len:408 (-) Transcript_45390:37-1260(-)
MMGAQCGDDRKLSSSTCSRTLQNSSASISRYLPRTRSSTSEASTWPATSESQAAGSSGGLRQASSRSRGLFGKASAKALRASLYWPLSNSVRISNAVQFGGARLTSTCRTSSAKLRSTRSSTQMQSSSGMSALASSSSSCSPAMQAAAASPSGPAGSLLRIHCSAKRWASQETLARSGLSVRSFHTALTGRQALLTSPASSPRFWCSRRSSQQMRRLPVASLGPNRKSPASSCPASSTATRSVRCHIVVSRRKMRMCSSAIVAAATPHSLASSSTERSCWGSNSSAGLLAAVNGSKCSRSSTLRLEERECMYNESMTSSKTRGHSSSHAASKRFRTVSSVTCNCVSPFGSTSRPMICRKTAMPPGKSSRVHSCALVDCTCRKRPEASASASTSTRKACPSMMTSMPR